MKCEFCSEENAVGSKFCQKCGAKMQDSNEVESVETVETVETVVSNEPDVSNTEAVTTVVPTAPAAKKVFDFKKYLPIGAAALAVLLVLIIVINIFSGGKFNFPKNYVFPVYDSDSGEVVVYSGTKALKDKIDANITDMSINFSCDVLALYSSDKELYCVKSDKVKLASEDVESFAMSIKGEGIVYVNSDDELYIYNCSNGKKTKIADDVKSAGLVISPDGKTVGYVSSDDDKSYVYKGNKSYAVSDSNKIVAVADSAKYIYTYDSESKTLYSVSTNKDKDKVKISMDVELPSITFNKDYSQVMFVSAGKIYFSQNTKDKQNVRTGASFSLVTPEFSDGILNSSYNVKSLLDNLYRIDGDVYHVDNKCETEKIASGSSYVLTKDAGTLFYLKSGDVYKKAVKSSKEPVKLAEDVVSFVASPDGKFIYYRNSDDELWGKKGTSDSKKVADDVYKISMTSANEVLILNDFNSSNSTGTLYSCSNGKDKKRLSDDVKASTFGSLGVFDCYEVNSGDEIDTYARLNGGKFKLLKK